MLWIIYGNKTTSAMELPLAPGSPALTLSYTNATPRLILQTGTLTSFGTKTFSGSAICDTASDKFKIVSTTGTWVLRTYQNTFALCVDSTGQILTSSAKASQVYRFYKLVDPSYDAIMDTYSSVYPIGVLHDFVFTTNGATMTVTYSVKNATTATAATLLMLTLPHHRCVAFILRARTFALNLFNNSQTLFSPTLLIHRRLPSARRRA